MRPLVFQESASALPEVLKWGAEARPGGHVTLLLHPVPLRAELHGLLSTRPRRSGVVWSVGLSGRRHPSPTELVQTLLSTHHLSGVRLVLLGLSDRARGELALLFPREVQEFVALSLLPGMPLRSAWFQELWALLNAPPFSSQLFMARGAA